MSLTALAVDAVYPGAVGIDTELRAAKKKPKKKKKKKAKVAKWGGRAVTATQRKHAHLLRRATYGPTPAAMEEVAKLGINKWLDRQLNPGSIGDAPGDQIRALYPEMGRDIATTRASQAKFKWDSMYALGQGSLGLAIWSNRQLYEVMVDFWSNHLNVTNPSDGVWDNRADYDRSVIRPHALGKFADMLYASAIHPAMLKYLDNGSSTKTKPNENYGRELLELHTVGVLNGYNESDVLTSARIMTGWGVDSNTGLAIYRNSRHWTGAVNLLGFSHANSSADGQAVAHAYLHHLARLPQTANRIAYKLCQRFVSDAPPAGLVNRLATIYRQNDTNIKPVLKALFTSNEFWNSRDQKLRRPYEDLIATMRTVGHKPLPASRGAQARRDGLQALYWISSDLQQAPMAWAPPNGYPDVAKSWAGADQVLSRINIHREIAETWWPNDKRLAVVKPQKALPKHKKGMTYNELIDRTAVRLIYQPLSAKQRKAVLTFFGKKGTAKVAAKDEIRKWRAGSLAALILNTPRHMVR